jgi:uncharacterized protein (DUF2267 family)
MKKVLTCLILIQAACGGANAETPPSLDTMLVVVCDQTGVETTMTIIGAPEFPGSTSSIYKERKHQFAKMLEAQLPCSDVKGKRMPNGRAVLKQTLTVQLALDEKSRLAAALGPETADAFYAAHHPSHWPEEQKRNSNRPMHGVLNGVKIALADDNYNCRIKYTAQDYCIDVVLDRALRMSTTKDDNPKNTINTRIRTAFFDAVAANPSIFNPTFIASGPTRTRFSEKNSPLAEVALVGRCATSITQFESIGPTLDALSERVAACIRHSEPRQPSAHVMDGCYHDNGVALPRSLSCTRNNTEAGNGK